MQTTLASAWSTSTLSWWSASLCWITSCWVWNPAKRDFCKKEVARKKVVELSEKYGLRVDPDALVSDISVGMQQRVEILKMLYRDNEILIFDEPTAVLTPQEIDELMEIMRGFKAEGKSILFITHKLNEIMAVADRCTVLRKGKYIGTVDIANSSKEELSRMMVGRDVEFVVDKKPAQPGKTILSVQGMTVPSRTHKKDAVRNVSFDVRAGEIVCLAGIEGNGQTELVYGLTGLEKNLRRYDHAGWTGHHPRFHPPALQGRHEPYPGGSP